MIGRILIMLLLLSFVGCEKKLTEEQKKEQWKRQAAHQSKDYKPSDGAFGAKDYANEAKQASEKDTQDTEQGSEDANH